jgi:nitrilase
LPSIKEKNLKVAVVQAGAIQFNSEACVDKAIILVKKAAASGAKVIVFPEAFIGGYPKGINYGLSVGTRVPRYCNRSTGSSNPAIGKSNCSK